MPPRKASSFMFWLHERITAKYVRVWTHELSSVFHKYPCVYFNPVVNTRQFMPVGYITLVDHLIIYIRVPHVYKGIKYTCIDNYPEVADMLLWVSACVLTLAVLVSHSYVVPPLGRNHSWRIFPLLKTLCGSWSEKTLYSLKDSQAIPKSLGIIPAASKRE